MQRILLFIYSLRAFLLFVILEAVSIGLIASYNSPQGAVLFNSSNRFAGGLLHVKDSFLEYFYLASSNEALAEKNAVLLRQLNALNQPADSVYFDLDSSFTGSFEFRSAKVINNSVHLNQNHLTLNKGKRHGIEEGMGVFNEQGIIGRVKGVSANFATVISLLHTDLLISSKIKKSDVFGSTKWDGSDVDLAKLMYVPRHVMIEVGDTVITSGYNAVFPEGIKIGIVEEVNTGEETNYLDIDIKLATDFTKLTYVYLVKHNLKSELDSLNESFGIITNDQ